ncbi:MAG: MATE family efflux transporter [Candidatus Krumholzibacteria bacterium]|nr:MATE family efflux transporter [Candidatus Krumholzibacteria bacterium]
MARLVRNSVSGTLAGMALPLLAGTFAMNAYNLTDTWFVSRLGTDALAAMSFTFPVVMLLGFLMRGLGTGAMTLVAHALGGKRHNTAARISTHAVLLSLAVSMILAAAGEATIAPVFSRLGASGEILRMTGQYMRIWYVGMTFRALSMLFADIIIATGRTKAASILIVCGTLINFVLDPVMIFGLLGFPAMGIRGAALATVISQAVVMAVSFRVLHGRYRLVAFRSLSPRKILASWRRILRFGVPSTLSSVLTPISSAVVIRIVSGFGHAAVAAIGVASRIEMFAFMIPMTVGVSMVPFVAQNFGARRFDRIRTARRGTTIFALAYGLAVAAIFIAAARPLGGLFSEDPAVIDVLARYIYLTSLGYGLLEVHRYSTFILIGIHRPVSSALLNALRTLVLLIPLTLLGASWLGLTGVFGGRLATDIVAGIAGIAVTARALGREREE